jgi:hypothetical protein
MSEIRSPRASRSHNQAIRPNEGRIPATGESSTLCSAALKDPHVVLVVIGAANLFSRSEAASLGGLTIVACLMPMRRAVAIDPILALRTE